MVAVINGGRLKVTLGSRTAYLGISGKSLMAGLGVRNHRRQGRLAAGSGGGGNRDQQRQPSAHPQNPLHFFQGLAGIGDGSSDRLGAVHAGTASKADQAVAARLPIKRRCLSHVVRGGVGDGLIIDLVRQSGLPKGFFQAAQQPQLAYPRIRDNQRPAAFFLSDHPRKGLHASHYPRRPVGQKRQGDF